MWRAPVPEPLHELTWPRVGPEYKVTSPYGPRSDGFHAALDIGNGRLGGPVYAVAAGRVLAVGFLGWPWSQPTRLFATGNYGGLMVVLEHPGGWLSLYAHLASELVSAGQQLAAGQPLGVLGETGSAIGQGHLHFSIGRGSSAGASEWLDPWPLLQESSDMLLPIGTRLIANRQCAIRPGVNVRAGPSPDDAILLTTAERIPAWLVGELGVWRLVLFGRQRGTRRGPRFAYEHGWVHADLIEAVVTIEGTDAPELVEAARAAIAGLTAALP